MTTKKFLVSFDPTETHEKRGDFIAPVREEDVYQFMSLRTKRIAAYGTMVYIGREITENDVFARLVETGRKIDSVSQTLENIKAYLSQLQEYKIGNVLGIEPSAAEPCGFKLKFIANTPHAAKKTLL